MTTRYSVTIPHLDGCRYEHDFDGPDWIWRLWRRFRLPGLSKVVNTIPLWWVDAGFPIADWCDMQDRGEVGLTWSREKDERARRHLWKRLDALEKREERE